jgi:hypothetical protein
VLSQLGLLSEGAYEIRAACSVGLIGEFFATTMDTSKKELDIMS